MANIEGAKKRIRWLCGWSDDYRSSPSNITSERYGKEVQSYWLVIGREIEPGKIWWVHERNSTMTTNRHIRALEEVLKEQGIMITASSKRPG
jgi:hypothetical protein